MLIAIVKKGLKIDASLYIFAADFFGVRFLKKPQLSRAFPGGTQFSEQVDFSNHLSLCGF